MQLTFAITSNGLHVQRGPAVARRCFLHSTASLLPIAEALMSASLLLRPIGPNLQQRVAPPRLYNYVKFAGCPSMS